jgi:Tfp pilus assembly PilM family ATPase/Tfp pilus assembly protein PilN
MNFLKLLSGNRKKIVTVFQLDNDWLRLVQIKQSKLMKTVSAVKTEKITSLSDDALSKIVANLSKKILINPKYLIISVPRNLTITRNLELPSTNPQEIKDMIDLQIGKQIPYSTDEVIRDYEITGSNEDGYSKALLVIVHREAVGRYFKILEAAGIKAERVSFSSEGLLNWSRLIEKQKAQGHKATVIIEVDYSTSDFEVILNNRLVFGRSISFGSAQFENQGQMDQWQQKFIEEIKRSVYSYQNEAMGGDIEKIIITGPKMISEGLDKPALENAIGLPVETIDQFRDLSVSEGVLNEYDSSDNKNLSLAALLGLAMTFGEQKIDLIPQELQTERDIQERGADLYVMGLLLVFILAAFSSIFLGRIYSKEWYLGQLKQRISEIQNKTQELNNTIRITEAVKDRIRIRSLVLNLLYEVNRVISPEIHIASISFHGQDSLTVIGVSNMMSEVFKFTNQLESSEYFQNVQTKYTTKRMVENRELTEFEIVCPLVDKYRILAREVFK